ncbi:type I secretion C-terminal target domain-containing protein [Vibrio aestuarianus]|uniref:type I secretion C-terminal target domain-containing protein n=2 Tax=Vibrio aestuarianus TaxID=28171 RepID=UPI0014485C85|nr:type I secretion C-terminal target domain-containing protein [Vibrio aestuarianus]NKZ45892.1 calcium-binding protein [Vibrio aestuarianus subsp. francensis]NLS49714.1 calcium-binding protein [Vibrio aestuarianus subsp. francensis]NLS64965.1 calcium-binding protein [Vibrio aestuarianus subsp. francensis]NLS81611.1 calcium-binding protein [Vibrio aestuarianus subsp. francensis]NOI62189.1 calcium-binding protein [Vibrio aestuarianus]
MGRSTFLLGSNLAVGQRIAVDVNGNVRILNSGEKALPGEIIMSPSKLGENDGSLNTNVQISQIAPDGSGTDITDDVNAIFAALEQGIDPTQLGEEFATAAGESNGSSPTDSVSITRDGAEIIAATNFDTSALTSLGLSQTQSLGLLEQYLNISEAIITDGGNTNNLPTADDFSLSSEHSVVKVDFSDFAKDVEDDADANQFTQVKLADLPEHGDLYYYDGTNYVKITSDMIGGDNPLTFRDDTSVYYVVDTNTQVTREIDSSDLSAAGDGVNTLSLGGMTISGGTFIDGIFNTNSGATIVYDHNKNQNGVYVNTTPGKGEAPGQETSAGEFISVASDKGNVTSATFSFTSLQGLLGTSAHAKIVAYTYDNGQRVGEPIDLNIDVTHPNPDHIGTATLTSVNTFDEVRLVVVNTKNGGQGAGFNLSGVEMVVSGEVEIKDDFTYWAVDSDGQQSASKGTVDIHASNVLPGNEMLNGGVDSVKFMEGFGTYQWATSAATIYEGAAHTILDYDPINGVTIDTGIANDDVYMGAGADTIYLGESHSVTQDINLSNQDLAINEFVTKSINELTTTTEDGALTVSGSSDAGLDIAHGGGGNDKIYGEDGSDLIFGGTGHDILDGGKGNDAVRGGSGNDTIIGGEGNDILVGDEGADIFKWVDMDTATDRVTDFNAAEGDQLDLSDLFSDMEKDDITALLNDLSSGDNEGHVNGVDVIITQDNSAATLSISKGGEKLTIDFDGASAVDITSNLMDNLNHLKD